MKITCLFILSSLLISTLSFSQEATSIQEIQNGDTKYEITTEVSSPMKTLSKNSFWGGATGLLVGLAGMLIINPDSNKGRYASLPMGLGVFAGTAYGLYNVSTRDDLYVDVEYNKKSNLEKNEKINYENARHKKVISTIKMRLDSPVENAFYDSLWGGAWGFMIGTGVAAVGNFESEKTWKSMRFGIGSGVLLGLGSSIIYNYIQGKKINDLSSNEIKNDFYAYYDPNKTSWNMGFKINY